MQGATCLEPLSLHLSLSLSLSLYIYISLSLSLSLATCLEPEVVEGDSTLMKVLVVVVVCRAEGEREGARRQQKSKPARLRPVTPRRRPATPPPPCRGDDAPRSQRLSGHGRGERREAG